MIQEAGYSLMQQLLILSTVSALMVAAVFLIFTLLRFEKRERSKA